MRVIECNLCGEVVQGAGDDELAEALAEHLASEHADAAIGEEQVRERVAREAYDATDA